MKVYQLTRDYLPLDYYTTLEVAKNAAEIDAEAEFEIDDVEFEFASVTTFDNDNKFYMQKYFPIKADGTRRNAEVTYRILEIIVKEEV